MRIFPMKAMAAVFVLSFVALSQNTPETYRRAVIRPGPEPGIRFSSGLSVCDEALRNGHWVSRYWLSSGMVKPDIHLDHERSIAGKLPLDAFQLSLEGQSLDGTWEWVSAI